MSLGVQPQLEHFAIYTLIYAWKQYLQLWNWQKNCYLHYNIKIFFLKNASLIINWLLSDTTCHRTERPPSALPFDQIWRQGDKNLNFQTFQWIGENLEMQSRLFKNPNFPSLLWIGKNLEIHTALDQHFKCWIYGWVWKTDVLI